MYVVLKTSQEQIIRCGSVYEAVRGHWVLDPERASGCTNVVAVVDKKVQEVFTIDKWYPSTLRDGRFVFAGDVNTKLTNNFYGKTINPTLCLKGAENPVRYVSEDELLEI